MQKKKIFIAAIFTLTIALPHDAYTDAYFFNVFGDTDSQADATCKKKCKGSKFHKISPPGLNRDAYIITPFFEGFPKGFKYIYACRCSDTQEGSPRF